MKIEERLELLAKQRAAYGYSELLPMRDSSRTVFIAPFLEREFFFICRAENVKRRDANRMWLIFKFLGKADNIGPDEKSLEMIRNGVPTLASLSDKILRQYLFKLNELHFVYKTHSSCKPWAPDQKSETKPQDVDWEKRALLAERRLSTIYGAIANAIHLQES